VVASIYMSMVNISIALSSRLILVIIDTYESKKVGEES